ncbi:MAG: nickel-dependent hydrogenase large subunit [Bacillota bacterium]
MSRKVVIDPVTRANNRGHVEITIEDGRMVDCRFATLVFRGFEIMLRGRDPRDAPYFTERICGICSSAHATAAAFALENLAGTHPPENGNLLRNLILAADTLQNHLRQFYLLGLLDYIPGPDHPPFSPRYRRDYRLSPQLNRRLLEHYFEAADMSRIAHEMLAVLGGKAPFQHAVLAGGATVPPDGAVLLDLQSKLNLISRFVKDKMVPDARVIAEAYPEYYELGKRPMRLLVFGMFPQDAKRKRFYFPGGVFDGDSFEVFDPAFIAEHLRYAYYEEDTRSDKPTARHTEPKPGKPGAYSWIKAPRYRGKAFEGGPLARLWILDKYRRGVSAMDRIMARVLETDMLCGLMNRWLEELEPDEPIFTPFEVPKAGEALGLTGSMRGCLLHYLRVEGGRIAGYNIITPSAWNFSPRDDNGEPGPVEEALLGTPVADPREPIELGRIIRSFDPCYSCATHLIISGKKIKEYIL